MPFIQAENPELRATLGTGIIALNTCFATLQAKDGNNIYAVSDDAMMELIEKAISFNVLSESQITNVLTPQGLENLERQKSSIQVNIFNITLPPLNCVKAYIICEENAAHRAREVLKDFGAEVTTEGQVDLNADSVPSKQLKNPYKIGFVFDRHLQNIVYARLQVAFVELASNLLYVIEMDPDGPPRSIKV